MRADPRECLGQQIHRVMDRQDDRDRSGFGRGGGGWGDLRALQKQGIEHAALLHGPQPQGGFHLSQQIGVIAQ